MTVRQFNSMATARLFEERVERAAEIMKGSQFGFSGRLVNELLERALPLVRPGLDEALCLALIHYPSVDEAVEATKAAGSLETLRQVIRAMERLTEDDGNVYAGVNNILKIGDTVTIRKPQRWKYAQ